MDPPSSSRQSTSDAPAPTNGPVPQFDVHLRVLTDSYLSFFQERKRIEETYAESLVKLHRKIKAVDGFLDDRGDLSTTRSAWYEVRDNVEREAQARQAFLNTLNEDVIKPLTSLKETQERTRKRIKEDLKDSGIAYNDYVEVLFPKLKSRYAKKFAEVEEQKKAAAAAPPLSPLPPPSPDFHNHNHNLTSTKSNPMPSRPIVTSPQPLRALDRRPSGSAPSGRNRSPSSTTAFSDLAHQGKKQLNSLIGFLDKRDSVKDSLGGRENQALRNVRAKRDLDEADKEYRKGVHWLETLRLRRIKILESGYKSLTTFVEESSTTVKQALMKYTDNLTATTTTETQLSSHARSVLDKISPEKDAAKLASYVTRSLASAIPEPILYHHGQVGVCNDLIFGISLVDYATANNLQEGEVPKIVRICIKEIDQRGLESEGIYRVSGRHAIVQTLQHEIEKNEAKFEFKQQRDDVYAVASLLKLYLRELPEPVFKFPLQERLQHTEDLAEHQTNNFMLLRSKMRRLPPVHHATLKALVEHLARVAACSEKNKMDPKNLAIVFGGVIFGEDDLPKAGDLLSVQSWKDSLMEDLIINAQALFDEQGGHYSPPLPPTPAGEPTPHYTYGSKTTRVASVPPTPNNIGLPTALSGNDFAPLLPPRPANSIHPSARANPSPTKDRFDIGPPPLPSRRKPSDDTPPSPSIASTVFFETDTGSSQGGASDRAESPDEFLSPISPTSTNPTRSPVQSSNPPLPSVGGLQTYAAPSKDPPRSEQ